MGSAGSSKFGERFDSVARELSHSFERVQNALTFKNLSMCEAYVEGRARIAVQFRAHARSKSDRSNLIAVWHKDQVFDAGAGRSSQGIKDIEAADIHRGMSRDENVVFIGDIEPVKRVEFAPPFLEGLYRVEDEALDCLTWRASTLFMSVKGAFRALPILVEGEECVPVNLAAVGFNERAVCMVECGPQIMDCVPDDGRSVLGKVSAQASTFPTLRVRLGTKSFQVLSEIGPQNRFELVDVMVGPFYL